MSFDFSPDEIFAMAEEIEKNGAAFYRKAAAAVTCSDSRELLTQLAEMEDGHEKTFAKMRAELPAEQQGQPTFDPEGEAALYLKSLADSRVFTRQQDPVELAGGTCGGYPKSNSGPKARNMRRPSSAIGDRHSPQLSLHGSTRPGVPVSGL